MHATRILHARKLALHQWLTSRSVTFRVISCETLRQQAKAHRRSITAETTVILERALGGRAMREDEFFRRARELRKRTPVHLTEKDRKEAAGRGRA